MHCSGIIEYHNWQFSALLTRVGGHSDFLILTKTSRYYIAVLNIHIVLANRKRTVT